MSETTIEVSDLKNLWENSIAEIHGDVTVIAEWDRDGEVHEMPLQIKQRYWDGESKWTGLLLTTRGDFDSLYRVSVTGEGEWSEIVFKGESEQTTIGEVIEVRLNQ